MANQEEAVALHEVVQAIAAKLKLDAGQMKMSKADLAAHKKRVAKLRTPDEKKAVLVSLVALAARLTREAGEATAPAVLDLMELAATIIGDPQKARALFAQATKS